MSNNKILEDLKSIIEKSPIIYKYVSAEIALKILLENKLKLTNPNKFNDPFDCYPGLISFSNIPPSHFEKLKKKYYRTHPELIKKIDQRNHFNSKSELSSIYEKIAFPQLSSKIGVTCFSQVSKDFLMWSHYAKSHSGICLGFDISKLYSSLEKVSESDRGLFKISYKKKFQTKDFFLDGSDSIFHLLKTKSKNWKYEREVRIIYTNLTLNKELERFISFGNESISEIIFGASFEDDKNPQLMNTISEKYDFSNKYRMKLKKNSFSLKRNVI
ncbi:DUF2971 domain-containing protein [Gaetbulibacter sp. M235]|uniref:DUF2971 domain-containing protein n=1 Tax=Gaetbulibacter sp. M235 TaxID=3126510 RepID=UPI00374E3F4D